MKRCKKTGIYVLLFVLISGCSSFAADEVSFYAGMGEPGFQDGSLLEAFFNQPYGITFDNNGDLLVADTYNNRIREIGDRKSVV